MDGGEHGLPRGHRGGVDVEGTLHHLPGGHVLISRRFRHHAGKVRGGFAVRRMEHQARVVQRRVVGETCGQIGGGPGGTAEGAGLVGEAGEIKAVVERQVEQE